MGKDLVMEKWVETCKWLFILETCAHSIVVLTREPTLLTFSTLHRELSRKTFL